MVQRDGDLLVHHATPSREASFRATHGLEHLSCRPERIVSSRACATYIYGALWTAGTGRVRECCARGPVVLVGHREQPQRHIRTVAARLGGDQLPVGHVRHDSRTRRHFGGG